MRFTSTGVKWVKMATAQQVKPSPRDLKAAWKAGEEAVESLDFKHIRRCGLLESVSLSLLSSNDDIIEEVLTAIMAATTGIGRIVAWKIAKALVTSEWDRAMPEAQKKA